MSAGSTGAREATLGTESRDVRRRRSVGNSALRWLRGTCARSFDGRSIELGATTRNVPNHLVVCTHGPVHGGLPVCVFSLKWFTGQRLSTRIRSARSVSLNEQATIDVKSDNFLSTEYCPSLQSDEGFLLSWNVLEFAILNPISRCPLCGVR